MSKKIKKETQPPIHSAGDETPQPQKKGLFARFMSIVKTVNELRTAGAAIGAVAVLLYGLVGQTKTTFTVIGTDSESIIVKVSISGPKLKWSRLSDYRLSFGDVPIEDADAELVKGDERSAVVSILSPDIIHITVPGLRGRCRTSPVDGLSDRYGKEEILSQISTQSVILTINVHENGKTRPVTQSFPAAQIKGFLLRHLPDHVPGASCSQ